MFGGARTIPLGHQQITLGGTATTLTIPGGGKITLIGAVMNVEVQNARYRDDGTAPTAGVGLLLKTTDPPMEIFGLGNLKALQFIQAVSGAILNVAYYQVVDRG